MKISGKKIAVGLAIIIIFGIALLAYRISPYIAQLAAQNKANLAAIKSAQ